MQAIEGAGIGLWDWNIGHNEVHWAGKSYAIFGFRTNQEIPTCFDEVNKLVHPDDLKLVMEHIRHLLKSDNHFSVQYRVSRIDGQPIWIQSSGRINKYKNGEAERISGTITDITSLKLAEEKEKSYQIQLESILDHMIDGVVILNEQGIIESCNKTCERIFEYTAPELIGQNINFLFPSIGSNQKDIKDYVSGEKGKIINNELVGQRKNGTMFPMDFSVSKIRLENRTIFSAIIRDITARKKTEYELKRSNQELEQFAYIASHDLKAPLRNIDNLAKWVIEDAGDQLPDDARDKMTLLRGRVERLEKLLNDILLYSRAGRSNETVEEIDLKELLEQLEQTHLPEGFKMVLSGDMPVFKTTRISLEQIFGNLLSNAVKHHDKKHGVIEVHAETNDKFYRFSIQDDGPGIPSEFHARVFQMFQTLQPRDKVDGSGLGMSIVKKLVENHNGKIYIESTEGERGARIVFTWPLSVNTVQ